MKAASARQRAILALREEARDASEDGESDGSPFWRVSHVFRRTSLPAELVPYAMGTAVLPVRPKRFEEPRSDDGSLPDWVVSVPERGTVRFSGMDAVAASAAFLVTLPKVKATPAVRSEASCLWTVCAVRLDGEDVAWSSHGGLLTSCAEAGKAHAAGRDALALAREVAAVFSALEKAASELSDGAASRAEAVGH